jgi:hypothetical protein
MRPSSARKASIDPTDWSGYFDRIPRLIADCGRRVAPMSVTGDTVR